MAAAAGLGGAVGFTDVVGERLVLPTQGVCFYPRTEPAVLTVNVVIITERNQPLGFFSCHPSTVSRGVGCGCVPLPFGGRGHGAPCCDAPTGLHPAQPSCRCGRCPCPRRCEVWVQALPAHPLGQPGCVGSPAAPLLCRCCPQLGEAVAAQREQKGGGLDPSSMLGGVLGIAGVLFWLNSVICNSQLIQCCSLGQSVQKRM